jgi:uncharacterized protein YndB with AHSA1/START domain
VTARAVPTLLLLLGIGVLAPGRAAAEVTAAAAHGFTVRAEAAVEAPPETVWRMLTAHVGEWWDGAHTYSGQAANLYIETRPNGCFCEKLGEDGAVVHLTVTFVEPGRMLRLTGGLGPLGLMGVNGNMTWSLGAAEGSTSIALDYAVGGYDPRGLDQIAPAVDRVLSEQLARLQRLIETGSPDDGEA